MALLAWKLDERGYGRRRRSRSQGIGRRDYQTIKEGGRNNKYKANITNKCITLQMKCYQSSNVGTMHIARSRNSSGDELPVPGDYRTGCPEGEGIMTEVSWTSEKCMDGVSGLVELF